LLGLAMVLMLVRVLVMARLLDTHGFGQYSAGLLVSSTFTMLACLGLQPVLYRELPMLIVRMRERSGAILLAQCIVVACACGSVAALATLAGASVAGLSMGLLLVSVLHGLSQQIFLVASAETRSRGQPLSFAQQSMLRSLGVLTLGSGVAYATASPALSLLAEALASLALAQAAVTAFFRTARMPGAIAYRLAILRLPRLRWRAAIALFALGIVNFVLMNADRWIAAQWMTPERFAQYAFAWTSLLVAQSLQLLINASVFPLLARRHAQFGAAPSFRVCVWVSCAMLLAGVAFGLPAWWVADAVIGRWFPDYKAASELLPLFIVVAVLRISDFWTSYLVIAGLEARLLALNLIAGAGAIVLWWLWAAPSGQPAADLRQIGVLALLLTVINYLLATAAAWQAAARDQRR
jgi:O-antigen/teichoic acid export membrane protein